MSLFSRIKEMFAAGPEATAGRARHVYVVDGARLIDERSGARLGPRDQVQVLQSLARVVRQEKLEVCAFFEGRPLREVEDGGELNGVRVRYAESEERLQELALQLCREYSRQSPILVSGGEIEKQAAAAGLTTMRAATFRKAFAGGGGGGNGGGNNDRRRQRFNRPQRSSAPAKEEAVEGGAPAQPPAEKSESSESDAVRKLIDLVE